MGLGQVDLICVEHFMHFVHLECTGMVFVESMEEFFDFLFSLSIDIALQVLNLGLVFASFIEPVLDHERSEHFILFLSYSDVHDLGNTFLSRKLYHVWRAFGIFKGNHGLLL